MKTISIATFSGLLAVLLSLGTGNSASSMSPAQSPLFEEGLTLHKKSTNPGMTGQPAQSTGVSYFNGNKSRETSSTGDDFIILFEEGVIVMVDHQKMSYSKVTFDEMKQQVEALAREASDSLKGNPQAMEMLKKMMGDQTGEVKITAEGPGETIAGYATQKYLVAMAPIEIHVWAAPELRLPIAYYDVIKARTPANPMFDMGKVFEAMKQVEGVALRTDVTVAVMGAKMTTTSEVTQVERGPIPESTFEVPEGYKKTEVSFP